jgi:hypothetical protein
MKNVAQLKLHRLYYVDGVILVSETMLPNYYCAFGLLRSLGIGTNTNYKPRALNVGLAEENKKLWEELIRLLSLHK